MCLPFRSLHNINNTYRTVTNHTHTHTHTYAFTEHGSFHQGNDSLMLMMKAARSSDTSVRYQTISQNLPNFTAITAPKLSPRISCKFRPYRLVTVTQVSLELNASMFRVNPGLLDPQYGVPTHIRNTTSASACIRIPHYPSQTTT